MVGKQTIDQFLAQKQVAVAGVSNSSTKFGTIVFKHLIKHGYDAFPVNPKHDQFSDRTCYPDILSLPESVTALITVTKPEITRQLVKQAREKGIKLIWMQQGSESPEAIQTARELGIDVVHGKCIMMFAEPVRSVHAFHRFLNKTFGKYPK
jgi:uncharacterized protein